MYIALILLVVLFIGSISIYNSLISKKNQVGNAFSAIDVMLKKRFDLLPNLVETLKQYMQYESETLQKITELRSMASAASLSEADKMALDQRIGSAVKGLMLNVEQYPDLKASQNFIQLQHTWTESEEQIAAARRNYNASVTSYNNAIMMFPGNLFSGMLGYQAIPVLETLAEERENVRASDLFAG